MSATSPVEGLASLVSLASTIQDMMLSRGLTLTTAESCTGGLIAYVLTEIPGSSDYFVGGLVSYSNELKEHELGVAHEALERFGAVSEETAIAMAQGARRRYEADVALSVTGIAGPGGGTDAKPVGLTYIGVADTEGSDVHRFVWDGDRHDNKVSSARAALQLLAKRLDAPRG